MGVLALAAEVTMPKLVIASVKPPYTMLFTISKLLPPLPFPVAVSSPLDGMVTMIEPPPSTSAEIMLEEPAPASLVVILIVSVDPENAASFPSAIVQFQINLIFLDS